MHPKASTSNLGILRVPISNDAITKIVKLIMCHLVSSTTNSNEKNGYIFPSDNAEVLMRQLLRCLGMTAIERESMGLLARERVTELCSTSRFRADYLALIDTIKSEDFQ